MLPLCVSGGKWVAHGLWLERVLKCPGARLTAKSEETQCDKRWGCRQKTMGTTSRDFQLQMTQKSTGDSNMAHTAMCQTATPF